MESIDDQIDEMEAKLLAWNAELAALPEDDPEVWPHVPHGAVAERTTKMPERVALLERITIELEHWLESIDEAVCIWFEGKEGVLLMVGGTDYHLTDGRVLH